MEAKKNDEKHFYKEFEAMENECDEGGNREQQNSFPVFFRMLQMEKVIRLFIYFRQ